MKLYVVRRPFKSCGHYYAYGDVISNPEDIKFFRTKCMQKQVIELPTSEKELAELGEFFKIRIGVDLLANVDAYLKSIQPPVKAPVNPAKIATSTTPGTPVVKPVVKTTK